MSQRDRVARLEQHPKARFTPDELATALKEAIRQIDDSFFKSDEEAETWARTNGYASAEDYFWGRKL
jgi:lipoate-protein ligase A